MQKNQLTIQQNIVNFLTKIPGKKKISRMYHDFKTDLGTSGAYLFWVDINNIDVPFALTVSDRGGSRYILEIKNWYIRDINQYSIDREFWQSMQRSISTPEHPFDFIVDTTKMLHNTGVIFQPEVGNRKYLHNYFNADFCEAILTIEHQSYSVDADFTKISDFNLSQADVATIEHNYLDISNYIKYYKKDAKPITEFIEVLNQVYKQLTPKELKQMPQTMQDVKKLLAEKVLPQFTKIDSTMIDQPIVVNNIDITMYWSLTFDNYFTVAIIRKGTKVIHKSARLSGNVFQLLE